MILLVMLLSALYLTSPVWAARGDETDVAWRPKQNHPVGNYNFGPRALQPQYRMVSFVLDRSGWTDPTSAFILVAEYSDDNQATWKPLFRVSNRGGDVAHGRAISRLEMSLPPGRTHFRSTLTVEVATANIGLGWKLIE